MSLKSLRGFDFQLNNSIGNVFAFAPDAITR